MWLETQRLIIRPLAAADASAALKVYEQSIDFLELQTTEPPSLSMVEADIRPAADRSSLFWGIFKRDTHELIGLADFEPGNFRGQADYAWLSLFVIRTPDRRQGYGAEAYQAIEDYIFQDEAVHRIGHALLPQYEPSLKFAEKMGYERAGGPFKNKRGYGLYVFVKKSLSAPETPGEKIWRAAQQALDEK